MADDEDEWNQANVEDEEEKAGRVPDRVMRVSTAEGNNDENEEGNHEGVHEGPVKAHQLVFQHEDRNGNIVLGDGTTRSIATPALIACGYKYVTIPKSGNSFPAFLMALPPYAQQQQNRQHDTTDAGARHVRFVWRTKRDFLILARAFTNKRNIRSNTTIPNQSSIQFPKSALQKVVQREVVPWRRTVSLEDDRKQDPYSDLFCDDDTRLPNYFSSFMKKSLWQIDHFLQLVYKDVSTTSTTTTTLLTTSEQKNKRENEKRRKLAWDIFNRQRDTDGLTSPSSSLLISPSTITTNNNTALSSKLGQYFASKENSQKVVQHALESILSLYDKSCDNNNDGNNNNKRNYKRILFIEPSCGHGDILVSLIEALQQKRVPSTSVVIQGYDIDPAAISVCRQRQEFHLPSQNNDECIVTDTASRNGSQYQYHVQCEARNFLETNKSETIYKDQILVCCLGGPPYTNGPGNNANIQRDLPTQFVRHCQKAWDADVITFLMPDRYKESSACSVDDSTFTVTSTKLTTDDAVTGPTNPEVDVTDTTSTAAGSFSLGSSRDVRWICQTEELKESTFYFRGKIKIKQPSIIQSFIRA